MELIKKVLVICLFLLNILPWTQNSAVAQNPGTEYEPKDHGSYIVWSMDDNGEYLPDYGHPVYEVPPGGIIITDNDNSNTDPNLQNNEDSPYEDDDTNGIPNWMDDFWDIDHDGINNIDDPDFDNDQDGIPNRDDPQWPPNQTDPCNDAQPLISKANNLSQNSSYTTALNDIQTAASNDMNGVKEHAITFGKDASNNVTTSPMSNSGSTTNGTVNTNWPGGFADLHNHPNDIPPSPGDLYQLITVNQNHTGYDTRMVVTQSGAVYALVIIDLTAANSFLAENSPIDRGFGPDFSDVIYTVFDNVKDYSIGTLGFNNLIAEEMGMAFVLDKYSSGMALLKQDTNGNFIRLRTESNTINGNTTYTQNNCQ